MPVGRISRGLARAERARQGAAPFEIHAGANVGGNVFNAREYPNLAGWWDTNQINANPGQAITHLVDLSGKGQHFVTTGGSPFTFALANGKPALYGDGTKQGYSANLSTVAGGFTVFTVSQNLQDTDDALAHYLWGIHGVLEIFFQINNINDTHEVIGEIGLTFNALVSRLDTNRRLWVTQSRANNTQAQRSNGVQLATAANTPGLPTGSPSGLGSYAGGASRWWNGYIHEHIIFNPALDDVTMLTVEKKLGRKWGLIF